MNFTNLLWILYFAAHTTAALLNLILEACFLWAVRDLGAAAWALAALWLVLAVRCGLWRFSMRGAVWRILATGLFPALCGAVDVLRRGEIIKPTPAVWAFFLSLLLLLGRILLSEERDVRYPGWERGLALLERGRELSLFLVLWLLLLGGGVLLMATLGFLFSLIIGGLIASRNTLLDYGGVVGIMIGLGLLYLLRCGMFLRAWRQAEEEERLSPWFALLVPVWGLVQAGRLEGRLRARKWAAEGYDRF